MLPIRTILHPTDFSTHSAYAFQIACALARDYHARLLVLHVWQPSAAVSGDCIIPVLLDEEAVRRGLEEQLRNVRPADPGIPVEHQMLLGNPVAEILRLAGERSCDLIVMGTHGRRGLGRLLMGSVAEQVVRQAPCLVLTLKNPAPEAAVAPEADKQQPVP
jgi:nucleotide-binding universal stress UspA family protein